MYNFLLTSIFQGHKNLLLSMEVWKGKFNSTTYPFIYGRLKTELNPLNVVGYTTTVKVQFDGIASIANGIFSQYMEPKIQVCSGNKFTTKIGSSAVEFFIDEDMPLSNDLMRVRGHYISRVESRNYVSEGTFSLERVKT